MKLERIWEKCLIFERTWKIKESFGFLCIITAPKAVSDNQIALPPVKLQFINVPHCFLYKLSNEVKETFYPKTIMIEDKKKFIRRLQLNHSITSYAFNFFFFLYFIRNSE